MTRQLCRRLNCYSMTLANYRSMFTLLVPHVREKIVVFRLLFFLVIIPNINDSNQYDFDAGPAYEMMKKCDLHEKFDGSFNYFPTVHDAVHQAMEHLAPISMISEAP